MSGDDELERLARRGRELREEERRALRDVRADDRRWNALVAVSWYARWGWMLPGSLVGAAGWWGIAPGTGTIGLGVGVVVGLGLFFAARPLVGRLALARERRWIARHPFALTGYLEAVGSDRSTGSWTLDVVFGPPEDSAPSSAREALAAAAVRIDDALLEDVLRALGAQVERVPSDPNARRVRIAFEDEEASTTDNARVVRWMHRVLAVLVRVHERHPIAAVRVRGFG